jgi:hypothetical protein
MQGEMLVVKKVDAVALLKFTFTRLILPKVTLVANKFSVVIVFARIIPLVTFVNDALDDDIINDEMVDDLI